MGEDFGVVGYCARGESSLLVGYCVLGERG